MAIDKNISWNPNDKSGSVVLSNGNLTATTSGSSSGIRAIDTRTSGKWYWETTLDSGSNAFLVGVTNLSSTFNNDTNKFEIYGYAYGVTVGETVGVAWDIDNKTIDFYVENDLALTRSITLEDTLYPFLRSGTSLTITTTSNFGNTPFKFQPPNGYFPMNGYYYHNYFFHSGDEIVSVDNDNLTIKSISSQTEQDFINYGIRDLSSIDFNIKYNKKQYIQNQSQALGNGKVFSHTVDFDKYIINKIEIQ